MFAFALEYVCEIKVKFGLDLRDHENKFGFNQDVTSSVCFFIIIITKFITGIHNVCISVAVGGYEDVPLDLLTLKANEVTVK